MPWSVEGAKHQSSEEPQSDKELKEKKVRSSLLVEDTVVERQTMDLPPGTYRVHGRRCPGIPVAVVMGGIVKYAFIWKSVKKVVSQTMVVQP